MKAIEFETACDDAINGWLWDDTFTPECTNPVRLSVEEMRWISNLIRHLEKRPMMEPKPWSEDAYQHSKTNSYLSNTQLTNARTIHN